MKFLCVNCDEPMKLSETRGPDKIGSLSVIFTCPTCTHEVAMLTNAFETQMVNSLGVKIGPQSETKSKDASKCPFSDVVQKAMGQPAGAPAAGDFAWTEVASARLEKIPEFVRPMAKMGIEKFAKDTGYAQVDEKVLDEAKDKFGM